MCSSLLGSWASKDGVKVLWERVFFFGLHVGESWVLVLLPTVGMFI